MLPYNCQRKNLKGDEVPEEVEQQLTSTWPMGSLGLGQLRAHSIRKSAQGLHVNRDPSTPELVVERLRQQRSHRARQWCLS